MKIYFFITILFLSAAMVVSLHSSAQVLPAGNSSSDKDVHHWPGLSAAGVIDAAVEFSDQWIAFFSKGNVIFYSMHGDPVQTGFQLNQIPGWPPSWNQQVDAAVWWDEERIMFFNENQYVVYNLVADSIDNDGKWPGWPSSWGNKIDEAVRWDEYTILFFKGTEYVVYTLPDQVTSLVQKTTEWEGWPSEWTGIDAVVNPGDGAIYFFRQGQYLPFHIQDQQFFAAFPRPLGIK